MALNGNFVNPACSSGCTRALMLRNVEPRSFTHPTATNSVLNSPNAPRSVEAPIFLNGSATEDAIIVDTAPVSIWAYPDIESSLARTNSLKSFIMKFGEVFLVSRPLLRLFPVVRILHSRTPFSYFPPFYLSQSFALKYDTRSTPTP